MLASEGNARTVIGQPDTAPSNQRKSDQPSAALTVTASGKSPQDCTARNLACPDASSNLLQLVLVLQLA